MQIIIGCIFYGIKFSVNVQTILTEKAREIYLSLNIYRTSYNRTWYAAVCCSVSRIAIGTGNIDTPINGFNQYNVEIDFVPSYQIKSFDWNSIQTNCESCIPLTVIFDHHPFLCSVIANIEIEFMFFTLVMHRYK